MKKYSHEHDAKLPNCVRAHNFFSLLFGVCYCFFDIGQKMRPGLMARAQ